MCHLLNSPRSRNSYPHCLERVAARHAHHKTYALAQKEMQRIQQEKREVKALGKLRRKQSTLAGRITLAEGKGDDSVGADGSAIQRSSERGGDGGASGGGTGKADWVDVEEGGATGGGGGASATAVTDGGDEGAKVTASQGGTGALVSLSEELDNRFLTLCLQMRCALFRRSPFRRAPPQRLHASNTEHTHACDHTRSHTPHASKPASIACGTRLLPCPSRSA